MTFQWSVLFHLLVCDFSFYCAQKPILRFRQQCAIKTLMKLLKVFSIHFSLHEKIWWWIESKLQNWLFLPTSNDENILSADNFFKFWRKFTSKYFSIFSKNILPIFVCANSLAWLMATANFLLVVCLACSILLCFSDCFLRSTDIINQPGDPLVVHELQM